MTGVVIAGCGRIDGRILRFALGRSAWFAAVAGLGYVWWLEALENETSDRGAEPDDRGMTRSDSPTTPAGAPRIVVMTTRSARGVIMLTALHGAGVHVDAVVVDRGELAWRESTRKLRRSLRREGFRNTRRRVARRARQVARRHRRTTRPQPAYGALADTVFEIADPNSDAGVQRLTMLAPDLVVLGSARILAPPVLAIPSMGVLNAHPGLLPDYRGVDVIPWALYHGDPLGVSVHYVDAGIDSGDIVARRRYDVRPGDTLHALTRRAALLAGELMADVVRRLIDTGHLERVAQPRNAGRTYTRMPTALRRRVEAQLAAQARS